MMETAVVIVLNWDFSSRDRIRRETVILVLFLLLDG